MDSLMTIPKRCQLLDFWWKSCSSSRHTAVAWWPPMWSETSTNGLMISPILPMKALIPPYDWMWKDSLATSGSFHGYFLISIIKEIFILRLICQLRSLLQHQRNGGNVSTHTGRSWSPQQVLGKTALLLLPPMVSRRETGWFVPTSSPVGTAVILSTWQGPVFLVWDWTKWSTQKAYQQARVAQTGTQTLTVKKRDDCCCWVWVLLSFRRTFLGDLLT